MAVVLASEAVAHPRMYADDDPSVAEVRDLALSFPEATEVEAWGGGPSWTEVPELLEGSCRQVALRRVVREREARQAGATSS